MNEEKKSTQSQSSKGDSGDKPNQSKTGENSAVESVKSTAKDVLDKAKDSAGQVYELAADKAATKITEQKSHLSSGLSGVAGGIRQIGQDLRGNDEKNPFVDLTAKYGDSLAEQVERLSGYFEDKDLREIYRDVENFARRQPAVFIGAAFVVGVLAARFLKSGSGASAKSHFKTTESEPSNYKKSEAADLPNSASQTAVNAS